MSRELLKKKLKDRTQEWKKLHQAADKAVPQMRSVTLKALLALRNATTIDDLARAIELGQDPFSDVNFLAQRLEFEKLAPLVYKVLGNGGNIAAYYLDKNGIKKALDINTSFNMRSPEAIRWARDHTAEVIADIDEATRAGVRTTISEAFEYGGHPYEQARKIRESLGLTERQTKAVWNYRRLLEETARTAAAVDAMVNTKIKRMLKQRAEMIARTETIRAANQGQLLHWQDMERKGYIDAQTTYREWIVTPDDRLCQFCASVGAEPPVKFTEPFEGGIMSPPLHPLCRCAVGLTSRGIFDKD